MSESEEVLKYLKLEHIEHCVDSIRQSLMCHADVSTLVYQWNKERQRMQFHGDVAHSCRNFNKIRDWAKSHAIMSTNMHLDLTENLMD